FDLFDDLCNSGSSIRSIFTNCLLSIELYDLSNDYEIYFEQLNETSCLSIPLSLYTDNLSIYFPIKKATCLLDELLFWLIKYHIPERLLKFFLMLLTDLNFKILFTPSFLNIYGMTIQQLINSRNSHQRINS
ncbi:unnamed protein product, partial [Adineta steineri]